MSIQLFQGDCREVLLSLPDNSVDACVTDPPYHLTTGKKGGTGRAAALEGFSFIGVELSAEYLGIAQARISAVALDEVEVW